MKNKTILVVDDTETNIDILLELLSDRYDIVVALDGESALDIVQEENIDLILLDIMMPDMDGYEVCKRLKANENTKEIPIIFITAKTDEESIEKAYDIGGIDYVSKPFKPKELLARVKIQLKMQTLIEHLEFLASHDSMTGIYNRRKFFELASVMFEKEDVYIVMIDIDKFKSINDNYGHPFGDEVIKQVTKTVAATLPNSALFARLGGEEFVIMYPVAEVVDINATLEDIRKKVQNNSLKCEKGNEVEVTISIGIAQKNSKTKNLDHLLKSADDLLYEAKNSGRNKTIFRI